MWVVPLPVLGPFASFSQADIFLGASKCSDFWKEDAWRVW